MIFNIYKKPASDSNKDHLLCIGITLHHGQIYISYAGPYKSKEECFAGYKSCHAFDWDKLVYSVAGDIRYYYLVKVPEMILVILIYWLKNTLLKSLKTKLKYAVCRIAENLDLVQMRDRRLNLL